MDVSKFISFETTQLKKYGITCNFYKSVKMLNEHLIVFRPHASKKSGMEKEFSLLSTVPPSFITTASANKPANKVMNAGSNLLPCNYCAWLRQ